MCSSSEGLHAKRSGMAPSREAGRRWRGPGLGRETNPWKKRVMVRGQLPPSRRTRRWSKASRWACRRSDSPESSPTPRTQGRDATGQPSHPLRRRGADLGRSTIGRGADDRTEHAPFGTSVRHTPATSVGRVPRHGNLDSCCRKGRPHRASERPPSGGGFGGQHRRRRRCGCLRASGEVAARGAPVLSRGGMQGGRRSRRKSGWPREGRAGKSSEPTVADARAREALGPEPGVAWKGADTESQSTLGWSGGRVIGKQRTTSHREVSTRDGRGNPWSR